MSDSTCLPTRQGTVYLSLVTDTLSRKIVWAHVHGSPHTTGCLAALAQAVRQAGPMTDGYDCYQNALAERVNGSLKAEFIFLLPDDLAQARLLV